VNAWRDAFLVAAGGASGALLRWTATLAARHIGLTAPGMIFLVNVSGCFAFGLLHGFCLSRHESWRLGGYTTFSSFGWDTFQLLQSGRPLAALANAAGSITAGTAAAWLGWLLASRQP
jgi:CrcB protein